MADEEFFKEKLSEALDENTDTETEGGETEPELVTKVKVAGEEYSQDDLQKLVGLGKLAREAENKYNTKIDKVWPAYGKSQNELKAAQEELEQLKQTAAKPALPADEEKAMEEAREAAKKLGIVTEDQFEQQVGKVFRKYYVQEREAEKLLDEARNLETEIDGKDGRPAFKVETILSHMQETGIRNPFKAYKDMFETELDEWKLTEMSKAKKPGMVTQGAGGKDKKPLDVKITRDNLHQHVAEALEGSI